MTPDMAHDGSRRFVLEMLGFTEAEKGMLASTFRLAGRRPFGYAVAGSPAERTDVYLVNADNPEAMRQLQAHAPNVHAPAVMIGAFAAGSAWPVIEKPIRWTRLFERLDGVMETALVARAGRQHGNGAAWDGRTWRRAADRQAGPARIAREPVARVLVVDDSPTVRAFMRTRLAPYRMDVDYAKTGEQALDMAQAKTYTCIFLDIIMPGIDGYQVCKRIKSSRDAKDTAVVMLSSRSSRIDRFRGSWAGCDAYLAKPVSEHELLATIARFLPEACKAANAIPAI